MMGAPSIVAPKQLRELNIRLAEPPRAAEARPDVDKLVAPE